MTADIAVVPETASISAAKADRSAIVTAAETVVQTPALLRSCSCTVPLAVKSDSVIEARSAVTSCVISVVARSRS